MKTTAIKAPTFEILKQHCQIKHFKMTVSVSSPILNLSVLAKCRRENWFYGPNMELLYECPAFESFRHLPLRWRKNTAHCFYCGRKNFRTASFLEWQPQYWTRMSLRKTLQVEQQKLHWRAILMVHINAGRNTWVVITARFVFLTAAIKTLDTEPAKPHSATKPHQLRRKTIRCCCTTFTITHTHIDARTHSCTRAISHAWTHIHTHKPLTQIFTHAPDLPRSQVRCHAISRSPDSKHGRCCCCFSRCRRCCCCWL